MGTYISLYGIAREVLPGNARTTPFIKARLEELGFSNLRTDLEIFANDNNDVITCYKETGSPGLDQYLLVDPQTFVDHVRANPNYWDSRGYGFNAASRCSREGSRRRSPAGLVVRDRVVT